jgi:hypothetical protein
MSNEEFQKLVLKKLDKIESDIAEIKAQGNRIEEQTMKLCEYKQAVTEKLQDIVNL